MEKSDSLKLGILLERRDSDHPWLDHEWVFVGVLPGAPEIDDLRILRQVPGVVQYHAATLELELHRAEAEAYHYNLTSPEPSLFVVLREDEEEESGAPIVAELVTASPYEAQDYMDSSEELVERILIPEAIHAWVSEFVDAHYREEPFKKRKRDNLKIEEYKFGQEPIFELRKRMEPGNGDGV